MGKMTFGGIVFVVVVVTLGLAGRIWTILDK